MPMEATASELRVIRERAVTRSSTSPVKRDFGLEHINNAQTGFIVSSTEELSARQSDLALHPELRLRLGNAAREHVTRGYSYENLVASYDNLYDELLSR